MRISSQIVEMLQLSASHLKHQKLILSCQDFPSEEEEYYQQWLHEGRQYIVQYIMQSEAHIGRLWMDSGDDLPRLIFAGCFLGAKIVDLYKKLTTSGW